MVTAVNAIPVTRDNISVEEENILNAAPVFSAYVSPKTPFISTKVSFPFKYFIAASLVKKSIKTKATIPDNCIKMRCTFFLLIFKSAPFAYRDFTKIYFFLFERFFDFELLLTAGRAAGTSSKTLKSILKPTASSANVFSA